MDEKYPYLRAARAMTDAAMREHELDDDKRRVFLHGEWLEDEPFARLPEGIETELELFPAYRPSPPMGFFRGLMLGIALSSVLWLAIIVAVTLWLS